MRKSDYERKEEQILNTNETMNDYSFFFQMICENKVMDFESERLNEKNHED